MTPPPVPRLSVIMTVRNGAAYLCETLDALAAQTFRDYELVINDNGSTDDTLRILAEYARRDARIRLIGIPPDQPSSFTQGIRRALATARGELVAVNDADDVPSPMRLEMQLAALDADPSVVLVATWFDYVDDKGAHLQRFRLPVTHGELVDGLQHRGLIAHSSVMYRRSSALAAGGYRERLTFASDTALWIAMAAAGGRLAVVPEALVAIRQHAGQASLMPGAQPQRYLEPLEIFGMAARLSGASWRSRVRGMIARQKLALRYGWALWQSGRRAAAVAGAGYWLVAAMVPPFVHAPSALMQLLRGAGAGRAKGDVR